MFDNVLVFFRLRTLYTFNCEKVVGTPEKPSKFFKKTVDLGAGRVYDISTMNKDLDTALMLIMGWIAFAMLVAAVNLVVVVGKLIFGA